jgi:hypothetical protein
LILTESATTISKVIPQKGTIVNVPNRVLIGLAKGNIQKFEDRIADLYYTGPRFPSTISLDNLHYFIPYFKDRGIRDVYEITKIRTITGREAKQTEDAGDDLRLAFHLKFHHALSKDFIKIDTSKMVSYTFVDTYFEKLDSLFV